LKANLFEAAGGTTGVVGFTVAAVVGLTVAATVGLATGFFVV
jgi:hypothetical protein